LDPEIDDRADWRSAEQCDGILEHLTRHGARPELTHRQETALRLVYLDGHSQQAAAALMGITPNALEKLLQRGKETIHQAQQNTKTRTEEGTR
jgi:DNA-directed RNA polymerase specialized sigma24 family protein